GACKVIGAYHFVRRRERSRRCRIADTEGPQGSGFAIMVRDLVEAEGLVDLSPDAAALLTATARPIVLARARATLPGVAPDNRDPGIMLPYTPLHHLLFAARAPSRSRRH